MCSAEALDWDAGAVPRSRRFDDPYYAGPAGRAETAHVFLAGNGLPGRWAHREGGVFQVAELGFGTGLSFLVTLEAWARAGAEGRLVFSSVEGFPMAAADRARALAPWPDLAALGAPFLGALPA
ncbi:MAG: FAD-dependent oxidoreductase, partial [Pseudomonadota bacterium]